MISKPHSFHIPVMGLAFTIDTPIKVAQFGINSVVSIMDDELVEQMRALICKEQQMDYIKIPNKELDARAKRITAYLNILQLVIDEQIEKIRKENFDTDPSINKYFELLPNNSPLKKMYDSLHLHTKEEQLQMQEELRKSIVAGTIDVNIMTKLDKPNYDDKGVELPSEYSDALAALRGYANSNIKSSIIFSAGMNPRLFSYCETFADFFPDENGEIKKSIILKVSDYRSALIQGKYLAKKGLWVAEYRVESGINCGGHAFISNGILLGPILEEFKLKRDELLNEIYTECQLALTNSNKHTFQSKPQILITAQGGLGTAEENTFLLDYYHLDATGWASPFLLVPEATSVDNETLDKLAIAKKEDFYLSHASPLGVPFNNFRPSSSEAQRKNRIAKDRPGSPCYKKFLSNNKEFTEKAICTASRQYQNLKIEQLTKNATDGELLKKQIDAVMEKDCLCEGLGAAALLVNKSKPSHNLSAVTICPGPNLAYFSGTFSLKQMIDHIYGRVNILNNLFRPNLFLNELQLYVDYFKKELENGVIELTEKRVTYFKNFKNNLNEGIGYYESLCEKKKLAASIFQKNNMEVLNNIKESLNELLIPLNAQTIKIY